MKPSKDHIMRSLLIPLVSFILLSGCDYPVVPFTPTTQDQTTKLFKLETLIPTDDTEPGNFTELTRAQMGSHLSLFSVEACCNLAPEIKLEMNHLETGEAGRPDIKGSLMISTDPDNFLYGTYMGSGERKDGLCELNCHISTKNCKGIFTTEQTYLNLCITGIYEQENLHPIAYRVVINGHLLPPPPNLNCDW